MGWFSEAAILGLGERGCMQLQWREWLGLLSQAQQALSVSTRQLPKVSFTWQGGCAWRGQSQEVACEPYQCHLPASSKSLLFTAALGRGCVQSMRQNWWARWIRPGSGWELQSRCRLTAGLASQKGSTRSRSLSVLPGSVCLCCLGYHILSHCRACSSSYPSWEQAFFTLPRSRVIYWNWTWVFRT